MTAVTVDILISQPKPFHPTCQATQGTLRKPLMPAGEKTLLEVLMRMVIRYSQQQGYSTQTMKTKSAFFWNPSRRSWTCWSATRSATYWKLSKTTVHLNAELHPPRLFPSVFEGWSSVLFAHRTRESLQARKNQLHSFHYTTPNWSLEGQFDSKSWREHPTKMLFLCTQVAWKSQLFHLQRAVLSSQRNIGSFLLCTMAVTSHHLKRPLCFTFCSLLRISKNNHSRKKKKSCRVFPLCWSNLLFREISSDLSRSNKNFTTRKTTSSTQRPKEVCKNIVPTDSKDWFFLNLEQRIQIHAMIILLRIDQSKLQGFRFLEDCLNCLYQNSPMNGCTMHPSLSWRFPSSKEQLQVNKKLGNSAVSERLVFFEERRWACWDGRDLVDNQVLR